MGGLGHVGLPLGLALAKVGHLVCLVDINQHAVNMVNNKELPFLEEGALDILKEVIGKNLRANTNRNALKEADIVFFVTGTPVDEHHNPRIQDVVKVIEDYLPYLRKEMLIILRSTVYPGVIELIDNLLKEHFSCSSSPITASAPTSPIKLAFCPERIVQGKGIEEIFQLPQIVSATSQEAEEEAATLFSTVAPKIIRLKPKEAEVAKLMTNAWRYIEFAIANQFYMITESQELDFYRIFNAVRDDYPRAQHFPRPGLAAGPCLFKDTMQLSAFHKNNFFLGQSAMLVNEGLPVFLVDQMEKKLGGVGQLKGKKIAILGMSFKANNDDTRESLAFKVKKILKIKMATPLITDSYLKDKDNLPLASALEIADGIILGVPHKEYLSLKISKPYVDCWGVWK
ncbi:MAG: nucleotide sugar dehydrogenase [Oligoflexia bacterium]|nr:nucleotide sugar dehydrogenase [Oligoflexia bacterium]